MCFSLWGAVWLRTEGSRADTGAGARILLVDPGSQPVTARLRQEIESLGLVVTVVAEHDPAEPLEDRARVAEAVGAIRITQRGSGSVEMTILDRATGKTVSRRLTIATASDPVSAELVALRTVELLRASLMELQAPHPARGDAPITAELRALAVPAADPQKSVLALATGPAVVTSPGLGASIDLWIALVLRTESGVGVTLRVLAPATNSEIEGREGSVSAFAWQYRLGAILEKPRLTDALTVRFEAGAAVVTLATDGDAGPAFRSVKQRSLTWGPWVAVGLRHEIISRLSVLLAADVALLFPETVIRSAGREVASFGRPLTVGSTGLEIAW
jgi:hypothetical protein